MVNSRVTAEKQPEVLPEALIYNLERLYGYMEEMVGQDYPDAKNEYIVKCAAAVTKDHLEALFARGANTYDKDEIDNPVVSVIAAIHAGIIEIDEIYKEAGHDDVLPLVHEELKAKVDDFKKESLTGKEINGRSWRNAVLSSTFSKDCESVLGR